MLNDVLLERAPDDPPPPRRNSRRAGPDLVNASPTPKRRGKATRKTTLKTVTPNGADTDDWFENDEDPGSCIETSLPDSRQRQIPIQERSPRNVGGWISPNLAEVIDRSWLENDRPVADIDPSKYVPQVGDVVLYVKICVMLSASWSADFN